MAGENDTQSQSGDGQTETGAVQQQQQQQQAGAPARGKTITLTSKQLKDRLTDGRARAAREAAERFETEAKKHGFASHAEMLAWIAQNKRGGGRPSDNRRRQERRQDGRNGRPKPRSDRPERPERPTRPTRPDRASEDLKKKLEQERKARRREEMKRKRLRRQLDEREVEMALRQAAWDAGIMGDVDYAVHMIRREIANKSEDELKDFDEHKYFETLRQQRPFLAGETVRPATTGTGAGGPPAPSAQAAAARTGQDLQVDARKMTQDEYREHLRKRGFSAPT